MENDKRLYLDFDGLKEYDTEIKKYIKSRFDIYDGTAFEGFEWGSLGEQSEDGE